MKIFDSTTGQKEVVIVLSYKEGKELLEMVTAASDSNKKKRLWKTMKKQLDEELCVFT